MSPPHPWQRLADQHRLAALLLLALLNIASFAITARAYVLDRRVLWVPRPPAWLQPPLHGWTFCTLFWHNMRRYHILLRAASVVPGHTAYTRAQNVQLQLQQWLTVAAGVALYRGAKQCTPTQVGGARGPLRCNPN